MKICNIEEGLQLSVSGFKHFFSNFRDPEEWGLYNLEYSGRHIRLSECLEKYKINQ